MERGRERDRKRQRRRGRREYTATMTGKEGRRYSRPMGGNRKGGVSNVLQASLPLEIETLDEHQRQDFITSSLPSAPVVMSTALLRS
jgi:hypothetical protein